ncbi:ATP-binding protein [Pontibacter sp. SGAir0037]|uniref:sensor histidine kinase n=1 Tax=Pontibacter sp. SGAir0037 TaxID=2571030 RepID=UPI0010CCF07F|nr:PAS domain-containing sensor histidine kinase [Pontibacter sp. SGAir0037]QCR22736.1 PAS domain-containing sensor histidine kinase [Pontibacter sp. SGAir0037]
MIKDFDTHISSHFIEQVKDCAIFAMDTEGNIMTWNIGAERIKGYKEEEIIGQYFGILFCKEDQHAGKPEEELMLTKKHGKHETDWWRRKKDGSAFWASIVLTAVYNHQGELIGFTKVTKDLTSKKLEEDALAHKNEELAKINRDLDQFIYIASHDLRAPILNIEALMQLLMDSLDNPSVDIREVHQLNSYIQASITRFKNTVDDLTTISKLQKSLEEDCNDEKVDVNNIFESIRSDMHFLFEESQFPCHIITDFQVKTLNFSRKNFRSILYNLLSNAMKYRSDKKACNIWISTKEEDGDVVLRVKDNGLGMSEENQRQLYTMFKRFHSHVDGSGIGMYIVKRIVDNAGGSIEVNSVEGEGTEFRVRFKS